MTRTLCGWKQGVGYVEEQAEHKRSKEEEEHKRTAERLEDLQRSLTREEEERGRLAEECLELKRRLAEEEEGWSSLSPLSPLSLPLAPHKYNSPWINILTPVITSWWYSKQIRNMFRHSMRTSMGTCNSLLFVNKYLYTTSNI